MKFVVEVSCDGDDLRTYLVEAPGSRSARAIAITHVQSLIVAEAVPATGDEDEFSVDGELSGP